MSSHSIPSNLAWEQVSPQPAHTPSPDHIPHPGSSRAANQETPPARTHAPSLVLSTLGQPIFNKLPVSSHPIHPSPLPPPNTQKTQERRRRGNGTQDLTLTHLLNICPTTPGCGSCSAMLFLRPARFMSLELRFSWLRLPKSPAALASWDVCCPHASSVSVRVFF